MGHLIKIDVLLTMSEKKSRQLEKNADFLFKKKSVISIQLFSEQCSWINSLAIDEKFNDSKPVAIFNLHFNDELYQPKKSIYAF